MSSPSVDVDATSRFSSSTAQHTAPTNHPAMAQRRPDAVQLSAADCSIGDDTGAVTSSCIGPVATSEIDQLPPPPPLPPFEPLFALLTNTTTGATVHPRVHYLFSDDDGSILAAPAATDDGDDPAADNNDPDAAGRHRSLVVDLAPTPAHDTWTVACASSLGPTFAVTAAALSKQQAEGGSGSSAASAAEPSPSSSGGGGAALMLHVEGVSRDPIDLRASADGGASLRSSSGSAPPAGPREDLDGLADDFRRRMGVLKKVVGEGEKRRRVVAAAAAAEQELELDAAGSNEIHDPGALRSETASQSHGGAALNTS